MTTSELIDKLTQLGFTNDKSIPIFLINLTDGIDITTYFNYDLLVSVSWSDFNNITYMSMSNEFHNIKPSELIDIIIKYNVIDKNFIRDYKLYQLLSSDLYSL